MSLTAWWRPVAKHRAVDRVVQLTAERDYLLAALAKQDQLLAVANAQTVRLLQRIDDLTVAHDGLLDAYDELWARHREATAAAVPAPADLEGTVPIPMPRVIPLSVAFAPNQQAA